MARVDLSQPLTASERRVRWIALVYSLVLACVAAGIAALLWNKPDPRIAYVPAYILFWAFVGGVVSVLMRAAYRRGFDTDEFDLGTWMLIKPVIAVPVGGVVYFIAVSGQLVMNSETRIENIEFLNVLAFLAGLSDRFAMALFRLLTSTYSRGGGEDQP